MHTVTDKNSIDLDLDRDNILNAKMLQYIYIFYKFLNLVWSICK